MRLSLLLLSLVGCGHVDCTALLNDNSCSMAAICCPYSHDNHLLDACWIESRDPVNSRYVEYPCDVENCNSALDQWFDEQCSNPGDSDEV